MTPKEYERKLKQIQTDYANGMEDLNTIIKSVGNSIGIMNSRGHILKNREKLLGIFIDGHDIYLDAIKQFKREWDAILK